MLAKLLTKKMEKVTLSAELLKDIRAGVDAAELLRSFNELYVDSRGPVLITFLEMFLCTATEGTHTELVNLLLDDPRLELNYSGDLILTLLSTAICADSRQFVELFLRLNASMNLLKEYQLPSGITDVLMSVIEYACVLTRLEILKLFVSYDAKQSGKRYDASII